MVQVRYLCCGPFRSFCRALKIWGKIQTRRCAILDLKYLRTEIETLREGLMRRGYDPSVLDDLQALDTERRRIQTELDDLRRIRNEKSRLVAQLKREGKDAQAVIEEVRKVGDRISELEKQIKEIESKFEYEWSLIPNIPHESVPLGKDEKDNVVIAEWGELPSFDFEPKPHWDLGPALGILNFDISGKISGSRFVTYTGKGALLERALINFFLDYHTQKHGYKEVFPPVLVRPETMYGSGQLPKFQEEMYYTEKDDLYLIPTAEVALANLHRDQILDEKDLPLYYTAYTACFRREAGSYGKDVRGMIRLHQFNKVELFKFTKPEESYEELEKMRQDAEEILQLLKIPYRVVQLCTGDLGFAATKTYDLEAWAPGIQRWLEVSSISNTEDFQARRTKTRFRRRDGRVEYVHTLNGSGLATPRTFIAILENYQQKDGSIVVPEVLRPYMGGLEVIEPEK